MTTSTQETILNLIDAAHSDESLLSELQTAASLEAKAAVAVRHGFAVTADDLKAVSVHMGSTSEGELSEQDLEMVAGGGLKKFLDKLHQAAEKVKSIFQKK